MCPGSLAADPGRGGQFLDPLLVALLTVAASVLFIPRYGAIGAGVAFLTGSFGGLMTSIWLSGRFIKVRLNGLEFAKAVIVAGLGGGVGRLTWLALPAGLPAIVTLAIAGVAGLSVWAAAALVIRPRLLQQPIAKARQIVFAKLAQA